MMGTMQECMKGCRWCPLIPVILGIVFFLLGYYFNAEIIRVLWMIGSGIMIFMGLLCLIMMNIMMRKK